MRQDDVAVVGMAGRFPGAPNTDTLWRNVEGAVESISFFADDVEMPPLFQSLRASLPHVPAGGVLDAVDRFDSLFFGFSQRESEVMDPQQRVLLETAWKAFEDAAHVVGQGPLTAGVFVGGGFSTYLLFHVLANTQRLAEVGLYQATIANDKDHLATRLAHNLDLTGPAVTVQTACSTSLVAVHFACQSLLAGECDVALAGGVSITLPQRRGYFYQEGGILSPDGHCRPFDVAAQGTVPANGAALVVLRRAVDAARDGDPIRALIRGSAVGNDGGRKVGYTAPSVEGQVRVLSEALAVAGLDPADLSYIEAHGTGTPLGDPIEVAALARVFGSSLVGRCHLGSIKGNVGHLDVAAGVTGLIKTVLALEHHVIPATMQFTEPNPALNLAHTPFVIAAESVPWDVDGPRRAGVSSLGLGGTNAHVVLEEAEPVAPRPSRRRRIIPVSATTASARERAANGLVDFLASVEGPIPELGDVARTLVEGRRVFPYRVAVHAADAQEAAAALRQAEAPACALSSPSVAFLIPGGGAQHALMASDLAEHAPAFADPFHYCLDVFRRQEDIDLQGVLRDGERAADAFLRPSIGLPALFSVEYALAKLWEAWGVKPSIMLGHSLGEYVAACLAGVLDVDDAIAVVAHRGRLFERLPEGAMCSVAMSADEGGHLLQDFPTLAVASDNGPDDVVVSGPLDELARLTALLTTRNVPHQGLPIAVAAHSPMVELIIEDFTALVSRIQLGNPRIPFVSNRTAKPIVSGEATDPSYWGEQLRMTVRFREGLDGLLADFTGVLVEIGPGRSLTALASRSPQFVPDRHVLVSSLPSARSRIGAHDAVLNAACAIWAAGVDVSLDRVQPSDGRRISLPTYPFERTRAWLEPGTGPAEPVAATGRQPATWVETWDRDRSPLQATGSAEGRWLLLSDGSVLATAIEARLRSGAAELVVVPMSPSTDDGRSAVSLADHTRDRVTAAVGAHGFHGVVSLWSHRDSRAPDWMVEEGARRAFFPLLALARAVGGMSDREVRVAVVTRGTQDVVGDEALSPAAALASGPTGVIPREYPHVAICHLDLDPADTLADDEAAFVLSEVIAGRSPRAARRGRTTWRPSFVPVELPAASAGARRLRRRGVYLITGGLGGVGLALARRLATEAEARLVLLNRTGLPPRHEWQGGAGHGERVASRIEAVRAIEAAGGECEVVEGDVADRESILRAVSVAHERFGGLHGVIHAAGVVAGGMIQVRGDADCQAVIDAKATGLEVLSDVVADQQLDFLVVCSALDSVLGTFGMVDHCAANAYLDAYARAAARRGAPVVSIGWCAWQEVGQAANTAVPPEMRGWRDVWVAEGVTPEHGCDLFLSALAAGIPHVIVSPRPVAELIALADGLDVSTLLTGEREARDRPLPPDTFAPPSGDLEECVARIWEDLLGIHPVGATDDYFELGGHSLSAMQLVRRLADTFGLPVSLEACLARPTVEQQAQLIKDQLVEQLQGLSDDEVDQLLVKEQT